MCIILCRSVYFSNHILPPSIHSVRKISYEGCTYREGDVVVLDKEDDSPILGETIKIYYFYQEDRCLLSVTVLQAEYYRHYHSYSISTSPNVCITLPQNLLVPHPVNIHKCFSMQLSEHKFVCLKCQY